jgi:hypothetical protein
MNGPDKRAYVVRVSPHLRHASLRWPGSARITSADTIFCGNTLKSFILRCLLFWPHLLRSLQAYLAAVLRGLIPRMHRRRKEVRQGHHFPGLRGCEGYSTIYASRDPNRSSEPHLPLESGSTRGFASSSHCGSRCRAVTKRASQPCLVVDWTFITWLSHHSDRHFPGGSTSFIANADDIQLPHIPHLSAPLTLTHSRITSTQFAGAPRRSRSRSPSPLPPLSPFTSVDYTGKFCGFSESCSLPVPIPTVPIPSRSPSPVSISFAISNLTVCLSQVYRIVLAALKFRMW